MPAAALIIALLAPPSLPAPRAVPSAVPRHARLTLWGTQARWDDGWRAFVARETADRTVVPVWERYETPVADPDAPAPSFIVMREMDCGQHAWRTTGVVRFPGANLEGEARFEPSSDPWRPARDAGADVGSIYGSVCRR